jgi:hypothetical protein
MELRAIRDNITAIVRMATTVLEDNRALRHEVTTIRETLQAFAQQRMDDNEQLHLTALAQKVIQADQRMLRSEMVLVNETQNAVWEGLLDLQETIQALCRCSGRK